MKSIGLSLFVLLAGAAYGQAPADGFYLRSEDQAAPSILGQDGKRLSLGRAQEIAIGRSEIYSEDNANSRFWLSVHVPYDAYVNSLSYVLVVSNRAYPAIGSGGGNGVYTMDFRISGADYALDVSRYLNTPIVYRRHPGQQLLVSFIPTRDRFGIGDEVKAVLRIENVGTDTISFMKGGQNRGSRDNQYSFSARFLGRQVQDVGTSIHHGGLAVRYALGAGEVFEDEISLSKWFAFEKPGTYEILGSYDLTFFDPNNETSRPIWTDYVSSEFFVRIDD